MLKDYGEKRDFRKTPEPQPAGTSGGEGPLIFVVQKHAARRLHYDLRLEIDGAFKSWAVPEGPSPDPAVKRLAVQVEDHPLDYASFEGIIPKGEYGAGEVIVWDRGDYSPDDEGELAFGDREKAQERLRHGLAKGKLSVFFRGQKLKGSWTLVKMKRGENNWLLIKHGDAFADTSGDLLKKESSVLSGFTLADLKAGRQPPQENSFSALRLPDVTGARKAPLPRTVSPMLAGSAQAPFSGPDWLFEPKLDGYRTIAMIDNSSVRLLSRRGLVVTEKYGNIASDLRRQPVAQAVLDGEIVALDEHGKLCFQCLQGYLEFLRSEDAEPARVLYYVFDLLYLDGYDLGRTPLALRKSILDRTLLPTQHIRPVERFEGDGMAIYRGAVEQGLEGVIAKKKDSLYEAGRRSADWLKVKHVRTDDFIVGGYTRGTGARSRTFGSLLLGYYDEEGRLLPAGHVGTGFDDRTLADFKKRLSSLETEQSPFAEEPGLNAATTWVRPELVVEVKFAEWTREGRLRAPVFLRLRDDKPPGQVRRAAGASVRVPAPPEKNSPIATDGIPPGILERLMEPREALNIEIEGYRLDLTNLDKALWPQHGEMHPVTKRDFLVYLARVSPYLLKHLRDRPLTLSRYPGGIYGEHFFQKHWNQAVPEFVETVLLSEHGGKQREYLLCNNLATLLWLGQVADLELHTWFSRVTPAPETDIPEFKDSREAADFMNRYPDFIIFDLDPYIYSGREAQGAEPELNREGFHKTCESAMWLKETLEALSLTCFVKTSGRTGLHIFVPILRQFDFHAVHSAAETICRFVLQRHSGEVTTEWAVAGRSGKVFLDYNQNARGKTLASVYSPRPAPEATVSVPLSWDELGTVYPTDFTIRNTPARLEKTGDIWENILDEKRDLKSLIEPGTT